MLEAENIKFLVVHCSATPDKDDLNVKDIHYMHLGFGWHGVGYHRVIKRDGEVEFGRPECWIGAHVYGRNEESLGVCLIGCDSFTDAQMTALEKTLIEWHAKYPQAEICGHCDFTSTTKTCPNFDVGSWWRSRPGSTPA